MANQANIRQPFVLSYFIMHLRGGIGPRVAHFACQCLSKNHLLNTAAKRRFYPIEFARQSLRHGGD